MLLRSVFSPLLFVNKLSFLNNKVGLLSFTLFGVVEREIEEERSTVFSRHFNTGSGCPWAGVWFKKGT